MQVCCCCRAWEGICRGGQAHIWRQASNPPGPPCCRATAGSCGGGHAWLLIGCTAEAHNLLATGQARGAAGAHLQRAAQVDAGQGPHHLPVRLLLQLRRRRAGPPQGCAHISDGFSAQPISCV